MNQKRTFLISLLCLLFFRVVACGKKEASEPPSTPKTNSADALKINTMGWEDSPYVTEDGNTLIMMYTPWNFFPIFSGGVPVKLGPDRPGHVTNPTDPWQDSNLYISKRQTDGTWSSPLHVEFSGSRGGCCAMFSQDGKTIVLGGNNQVGPVNKMDIYFATMKPDGTFTAPVNPGAPLNTQYAEDNPHLSWDNQTLYFTSDRPGSTGGKDIYVSHFIGGTWSEPQLFSADPLVNSGDEDQVWVSKDESLVYFGRQGTRLPLYVQKIGNTWTSPQEFPLDGIDTIGEISFSLDMSEAYFAVVNFDLKDIILSKSLRQSNGRYSKPVPLD